MNLLVLSELFAPHGSGAELATYLYAKFLGTAGVKVRVVTNQFSGESMFAQSDGFFIHRYPLFRQGDSPKFSAFWRADFLFSGFMRKMFQWADVVYVPRFWYSAILAAKSFRKPVIIHVHDYIPICPLSNFYNTNLSETCKGHGLEGARCIYRWEKMQSRNLLGTLYSVALNSSLGVALGKFARLADAVVCVSKTQCEILSKVDKNLQGKMEVIYNPLPDVKRSIGGDDFGYFGGPNYLKGFSILYKALNLLNKDDQRNFAVQATNFKVSSSFSAALRKVGIITHPRLVDNEYERLNAQIGFVIVPSVWAETFSYVVTEALQNEKIVVASAVGAIPEVTEGCKGVFLFKCGDPQDLAAKIQNVRNLDRSEILELGKSNKECAIKKFDRGTSIRKFADVVNKVTQ